VSISHRGRSIIAIAAVDDVERQVLFVFADAYRHCGDRQDASHQNGVFWVCDCLTFRGLAGRSSSVNATIDGVVVRAPSAFFDTQRGCEPSMITRLVVPNSLPSYFSHVQIPFEAM
jgi:hypothetical protein